MAFLSASKILLLDFLILLYAGLPTSNAQKLPRKCLLPRDDGDSWGTAYTFRYYYNHAQGVCLLFFYTGKGGNANKFRTYTQCQRECSPQTDLCHLPKDPGPCEAEHPRYYYDKRLGRCIPFIYGGCSGNANNFKSFRRCHKMCSQSFPTRDPCEFPKKPGPCTRSKRRYYFTRNWFNRGMCKSFIYGGCQGNPNNFQTLADCKRACLKNPCLLPKKPGPCKGYIIRYHYDKRSRRCKQFVYGGCRGNGNNFKSKSVCMETCVWDRCFLPKRTGPCRAAIRRFYYDFKLGRCRRFIYGGCAGNANNFRTRRACKRTCALNRCTLPARKGRCRARFRRYYFNYRNKRCQRFIYGGCGGNANNFWTFRECRRVCSRLR